MLRWRIRSALYIDFENVPLPPDAIANWLAWLEDGVFDPTGRRRRFLQKRVYWNSHAERNRALFQRHGFAPILIGKYSGLKNGADIRMAMDVVEATYTRDEIDEFILLTGDSDFVPVIERLRQKAKRSAIVATEHRPNIHTTYHSNADILIPSRRLPEAAQYKRPMRGLLARILSRSQDGRPLVPAAARTAADAAPPAPRASAVPRPARKVAPEPVQIHPAPILETAAKHVLKLLLRQPRNYVAQRRVVAEFEQLEGFKRQGPTAFFGTGSYKNLLKELTRLEPKITVVDQPGGGTGVVFIPPSADASATPMPPPIATPAPAVRPANDTGMTAHTGEPRIGAVADQPHHPTTEADLGVGSEPRPAAPPEIASAQSAMTDHAHVPVASAPRLVAAPHEA